MIDCEHKYDRRHDQFVAVTPPVHELAPPASVTILMVCKRCGHRERLGEYVLVEKKKKSAQPAAGERA